MSVDPSLSAQAQAFLQHHNQEASRSGHDEWTIDPEEANEDMHQFLEALGSRFVMDAPTEDLNDM